MISHSSGSTVTIVGVGETTITATQAVSRNFGSPAEARISTQTRIAEKIFIQRMSLQINKLILSLIPHIHNFKKYKMFK
jgi:hypothetical protein